MEPWVSRSRPGMQMMLAIGSTAVGLLLMVALRGFRSGDGNVLAGFLLGVLLFVVGIAAALMSGPQTVTVDPRVWRIEVVDSFLLGGRTRTILFGQIDRVAIGYLGKASNRVQTYYLVLHLVDGQEYPLFAPGRFFEGASDRGVVESWRDRLEGYLHAVRVRG